MLGDSLDDVDAVDVCISKTRKGMMPDHYVLPPSLISKSIVKRQYHAQ